jgi:hypothetical protein
LAKLLLAAGVNEQLVFQRTRCLTPEQSYSARQELARGLELAEIGFSRQSIIFTDCIYLQLALLVTPAEATLRNQQT